ncbi:MAG TPA: hypothetical protein VII87_04205 [Solirubrobacteraceae bacterium]|jgi:hypothetical protein
MKVEFSRLRRGELIAGAAALVLILTLFGLPWYGLTGAAQRSADALGISTSVNGWHGLTDLRWLILLTALTGLALAVAQSACRAPALPVSLSTITTVLGVVTCLALIDRVLLNVPGPSELVGARVGAYAGLISGLALTAGAFVSLREEDPADPVRNAAIETVHLG